MDVRQPSEAEVMATTLPNPANWKGWYCTNHPLGEDIANEEDQTTCWGCGEPQPKAKNKV